MFIAYGLIPFTLFVLFHIFYIFIGMKLAKLLKAASFQIAFWIVYGLLGIVLVYTDLIWKSYPSSTKSPNHYAHYERVDTSKYATINIHGIIDPDIDIVFTSYLHNSDKRCNENPTYKHTSKRFEYPMIQTDQYHVSIYKEFIDKKSNCHYFIDSLWVELYKSGLDEPFFFTGLFIAPFREEMELICSDRYRDYTYCNEKVDYNTSQIDTVRTSSIKLDILVDEKTEEISGRKKETPRKGFSDIIEKFQIAKFDHH